jgi:nucleobase:cation symporter-1, NCS1 family
VSLGVEDASIEHITDQQRHGRVADQTTFWFLGNFHFFTISIGFVGPGMGLSFGYTVLAATIGILFGTLFVAFHASQGPELGLPQMIQSRAQFGFRGVVIVLIGTLFTFLGFNVANGVLIAQGLHGIFGWNAVLVTGVVEVTGALLAIYGHDWLHRVFRWCFILSVPLYLLLTLWMALGKIPETRVVVGGFTWTAFIAQFAASASFNITYAPSVSDYSRYLPRNTKPLAIIAAVYAGAASSAIWLIAVGAWLATRLAAADGLLALYDASNAVLPHFGAILSLVSVAALVAATGLNFYSGMLTVVTALSSLFELRPRRTLRVLTIAALCMVATTVALTVNTGAIALLFTTLTIMLYLLIPWTSINLIDYFLVRRGRYAITELLNPNGIYGAWGARGLTAYAAGFFATLPFIVLPDVYSGPAARALGGVDVGWLVGLVVSAAVYLQLARSFQPAAEMPAIRASEQRLGVVSESSQL